MGTAVCAPKQLSSSAVRNYGAVYLVRKKTSLDRQDTRPLDQLTLKIRKDFTN
jgi:hypothetical protein